MAKETKKQPRRSRKSGKTGGCKKRGCKGWRVGGSVYCFAHDPKLALERKEARQRGGKSSTAPKTLDKGDYPLQTIPEVQDMLQRVTNAVITGGIDMNRARVAGYLASLILSCLKDHDLERRIEALEKTITSRR